MASAAPQGRYQATSQMRAAVRTHDRFSCRLTTGIVFWGRYPGRVRAYAYVDDCHGVPVGPTTCTAEAELQIYFPRDSSWEDDGSGPSKQTCSGSPKAESRVTKKCKSTSIFWRYRTKGIFIIHWEGRTYSRVEYSPERSKIRLC
jgi:hypothetical protein